MITFAINLNSHIINTFEFAQIYGAYLLHIYTTDIYFFVMANLFYSDPKLSINEKYDIKGSTVNRSFEAPKEGQSSTCRHCEQKFVYRSKKIKRKVFPTPQTTTMIASTSRGIKSVVMMTQLGSTDTVDLHGSASVQDLAATTAHRLQQRDLYSESNANSLLIALTLRADVQSESQATSLT